MEGTPDPAECKRQLDSLQDNSHVDQHVAALLAEFIRAPVYVLTPEQSVVSVTIYNPGWPLTRNALSVFTS